ncbi:MAG: hypothetical protein AAB151_01000, partial [Nitrospirota bacterium]
FATLQYPDITLGRSMCLFDLYNEADPLISWNFKHMVKLKTIRGVNGINRMLGFKELEILTPQSLIQEDNNE